MSTHSSTFLALLKEGQFTKQLLGAGATQIRKANYASKGAYFHAFTSLSTGLERIGKLVLLLDYYIENQGSFPTFTYLKNEIGHDLEKLQEQADLIVQRRSFNVTFPLSPVHASIVRILGDFAKSDRYSNLDLVVGSRRQSDPIATWFREVDVSLFDTRITNAKKAQIARNAQIVGPGLNQFLLVRHSSENGTLISDIEDARLRTGIFEAVAPYRQLYVLQIIRYWSELLRLLQYAAQEQGCKDIPFFSEIFAAFGNNDSYLRSRKTWDSV